MPEELLPWVLLFTAILFEVAGITSMKLSRGFSEPLPSLAVPVFYIFSALAVILALKRLELSTAYAIWSGVGTALFLIWEKEMHDSGARLLMTSSECDESRPQDWHRRNGFSETGSIELPGIQLVPEVFFLKKLD